MAWCPECRKDQPVNIVQDRYSSSTTTYCQYCATVIGAPFCRTEAEYEACQQRTNYIIEHLKAEKDKQYDQERADRERNQERIESTSKTPYRFFYLVHFFIGMWLWAALFKNLAAPVGADGMSPGLPESFPYALGCWLVLLLLSFWSRQRWENHPGWFEYTMLVAWAYTRYHLAQSAAPDDRIFAFIAIIFFDGAAILGAFFGSKDDET